MVSFAYLWNTHTLLWCTLQYLLHTRHLHFFFFPILSPASSCLSSYHLPCMPVYYLPTLPTFPIPAFLSTSNCCLCLLCQPSLTTSAALVPPPPLPCPTLPLSLPYACLCWHASLTLPSSCCCACMLFLPFHATSTCLLPPHYCSAYHPFLPLHSMPCVCVPVNGAFWWWRQVHVQLTSSPTYLCMPALYFPSLLYALPPCP